MERRRKPVVSPVSRAFGRERPVTDHEVVEVVGRFAVLVAFDVHASVRIEQLRHLPRDPVEFNAGQAAVGHDVTRHQAKEIADAHRRFEDAAALETHLLGHVPHGLDRGRVRVVGVDDGALRRLPRLLAKVLPQPLSFFHPALTVRLILEGALEQVLAE